MQTQQLDLTNIKDLIEKSLAMKEEIIALRQTLEQTRMQMGDLDKHLQNSKQDYEIKIQNLLTEQKKSLQLMQDSLNKAHTEQLAEATMTLNKTKKDFEQLEQQLKSELATTKQTNQFILNRVRGATNEN